MLRFHSRLWHAAAGFRGIPCHVCLVHGIAVHAPAAMAQSGEPLTVEADKVLEWNQTDGRYTATGNAVAVQGARTIRGDVLVASYDPDAEQQDIETITATGNVSFKDDDTEASGGKLIYNITAKDYRVDGPKARVSGARGTITANTTIILETARDETQTMTARGSAVYRTPPAGSLPATSWWRCSMRKEA